MDTKDQIKEKLDIVDVVASYIQLKKAGSNYRARCPFHGEKTPSFMVSPAKQMFYCFGCNAGGDIFSFVQKIENCDFLESVKTLAPRAGVSLEKMQFDKDSGIKSRLKEMSQRSAMLYHKILTGNPAGQRALAYLKGRGLTDETIQRWTIGFAPLAWDTLTKALKSKNYTESEIVMAGLAVKNDKGRVYDRFRGRITFPVANSSGEIIGYSARLLDEGDEKAGGKYINTPETQIYHKSAILFGYDKAKKEAAAKNALILMEGNLDVILSHQAGVQNAVGVSGTGLSSEQLKLISRLTDTLNLCFDADSAGERAAERSLSLSSEYDFNINFIVLPKTHKGKEIKDPADLASIDAEAWQKASQNAIPMMEHLLDTLIKKTNLNDPQQKKKAIDKYMGYIISLRNSIDQHHWLSKCAQRFGEPENILQEKLPKNKTVKAVQQPQSNTAKNRSQRIAELL
jgi:DNA primase